MSDGEHLARAKFWMEILGTRLVPESGQSQNTDGGKDADPQCGAPFFNPQILKRLKPICEPVLTCEPAMVEPLGKLLAKAHPNREHRIFCLAKSMEIAKIFKELDTPYTPRVPSTIKFAPNVLATFIPEEIAQRSFFPLPPQKSNLENRDGGESDAALPHPRIHYLNPDSSQIESLEFDKVGELSNPLLRDLFSSPETKPWLERKIFHQPNPEKIAAILKNESSANPGEGAPQPREVVVIGAGVSGAAVARSLAERGVPVTVLEKNPMPGMEASGNRQGLLYAKIAPEDTRQTLMLLASYAFARRTVESILKKGKEYDPVGVLHVDVDEKEKERNDMLSSPMFTALGGDIYERMDKDEAGRLAGLELPLGGLYWKWGAWISPSDYAKRLLDHPLIEVRCGTEAIHLESLGEGDDAIWKITTRRLPLKSDTHDHSGSRHESSIVVAGKDSMREIRKSTSSDGVACDDIHEEELPKEWLCALNLVLCANGNTKVYLEKTGIEHKYIRGQTTLIKSEGALRDLKTALSGDAYISPAIDGWHCFGATFGPGDDSCDFREADDEENLANLKKTLPGTIGAKPELGHGHTAFRTDSYDHLPFVGAMGDRMRMAVDYAKLSKDKNYRVKAPCPYTGRVFTSSAHGSRGLASIPLAAEAVVAEIMGLPSPYSEDTRIALSPNRAVVKEIVTGRLPTIDS